MAVAMIGPKFYAWDRNGKPLAFGKVFTYQARTNTPKVTYQSEDAVVPNTNPVILNGEGYANIYLDGSYKIVVKDSDDNEIWTADPVTDASGFGSEWINERTATHVSPTKFSVDGNETEAYQAGRSVRVHQNSGDVYGFITESSFGGGVTTVTVAVTDGTPLDISLDKAWTGLLTQDSVGGLPSSIIFKETLPNFTDYVFSSVEDMRKQKTIGGDTVELKEGMVVKTLSYTIEREHYWKIVSTGQAAVDEDTAGDGTIYIDGSVWAQVYISDGKIKLSQFGVKDSVRESSSVQFANYRDYVHSLRAGSGSGPNQNSLFGLSIHFDMTAFMFDETIEFGPLLHCKVEAHGCDVFWGGDPQDKVSVANGDLGLKWNLCSWFYVEGGYFYCPVRFNQCYRLRESGLVKYQGIVAYRDCWNVSSHAHVYQGQMVVLGGHSTNFFGGANEFGTGTVTVINPDSCHFFGEYTENSVILYQVEIVDAANNPDGWDIPGSNALDGLQCGWHGAFLDVQKQSSVNVTPGSSSFRFINHTDHPVYTSFVIDGSNFRSAALPPAFNADGVYVWADDSFYDVRVVNSSNAQANLSLNWGGLTSDLAYDYSSRLFKGAGVYCDGFNISNESPLCNGELWWRPLESSERDGLDQYRDFQHDFWYDGTFGAVGKGYFQINNAGSLFYEIPVNADNQSIIGGSKYWLAFKYKFKGVNVKAFKVTGSGAGKTVDSTNLVQSPWDATTPNSDSNIRESLTLINVPADADFIRLEFESTDFTRFFEFKMRQEKSNPVDWTPRRKKADYIFVDALPAQPANVQNAYPIGTQLYLAGWTGTGSRGWQMSSNKLFYPM